MPVGRRAGTMPSFAHSPGTMQVVLDQRNGRLWTHVMAIDSENGVNVRSEKGRALALRADRRERAFAYSPDGEFRLKQVRR
jgi:hypothetical protein